MWIFRVSLRNDKNSSPAFPPPKHSAAPSAHPLHPGASELQQPGACSGAAGSVAEEQPEEQHPTAAGPGPDRQAAPNLQTGVHQVVPRAHCLSAELWELEYDDFCGWRLGVAVGGG